MQRQRRGPWTRNWTAKCVEHWTTHVLALAGTRPLKALEIGVFEGQSALWLLEHVLTEPGDRYIGIDPWVIDNMSARKFPRNEVGYSRIAAVEQLAHRTLAPFGPKARLIKGNSQLVLADPQFVGLFRPESFDFVYVDGDHTFAGVSADTAAAWRLTRTGGILAWDDYQTRIPARAKGIRTVVDGFLRDHASEIEVLWHDYQVGVRRLPDQVR